MAFLPTFNQMLFLFAFMLVGYLLVKCRVMDLSGTTVLSKLETYLFVPALVMQTFWQKCTVPVLAESWKVLLFSGIMAALTMPVGILLAKLSDRDPFVQKVYTYGLCFSNFGYMGNAVVQALFPEYFFNYLVFTMLLFALIYSWGITLLIPEKEDKTFRAFLKRLCNPMFLSMLVGILLGLTQPPVPKPLENMISTAAGCMSPVAMLLTGMTVACYPLKQILGHKSLYLVTFFRLIALPVIYLLLLNLFSSYVYPLPKEFLVIAACTLVMPLGLNTVIIPAAYGRDTSVAAGMALVSHALSVITIPVMLLLFA